MGQIPNTNINLQDFVKCCSNSSDSEHQPAMDLSNHNKSEQLDKSMSPVSVQAKQTPEGFHQKQSDIQQFQNGPSDQPVETLSDMINGQSQLTQLENNSVEVLKVLESMEPFDWNVQSVPSNPNREFKPMKKEEDGSIYEGEWVGNTKDGRGIYKWHNGSRYDGFWSQDQNNGFGRLISINGDVYEGQWLRDMQHGWGKMSWGDGSSFEGDFFEKKIQGTGTYKWVDGRVFTGDWVDNLMHGQGIFTWLDGKRYEGAYENDKKQGFGKFYWPDGRVYIGEWKDGRQHGKGEYTHKNGQKKKGVWKDGKRVNWIKDDIGNALLAAVKAKQQPANLLTAASKLLCEDAVDKDMEVDDDFYIPLDEFLAEKTIAALNPTYEQIEAVCKKSEGLIEIRIIDGERRIRATKNHKFTAD